MDTLHFEGFEKEARGILFIKTANFSEVHWSLKRKSILVLNEMQMKSKMKVKKFSGCQRMNK